MTIGIMTAKLKFDESYVKRIEVAWGGVVELHVAV